MVNEAEASEGALLCLSIFENESKSMESGKEMKNNKFS